MLIIIFIFLFTLAVDLSWFLSRQNVVLGDCMQITESFFPFKFLFIENIDDIYILILKYWW